MEPVAPLETERLVLPRWDDQFLEDLVRMSSDERVMRYVSDELWTREFAEKRHAAVLRRWEERGFGWRAILRKSDRAFLGLAAAGWTEHDVPSLEKPAAEIGWWVEPHVWGQGIATEAMTTMLDDVFHRTKASSVMAGCDARNAASERVMVKLGMSRRPDITDENGRPARIYAVSRPG
ncbi:GNAT family N-acetyltransferase [Actinomadura sp. 7K534]|uniref:GNAT family N-acetyltransferase n=1 Tax=Actinomadura sp. 7K534 TaxID=2530366 RepID=UPI00104B18FE|nr:GNAT family N-acetyltransferase [Actinomadura sp. 7K534]TDB98505.1 N-acetyltransferase [Actinomadura sp. 7K534]